MKKNVIKKDDTKFTRKAQGNVQKNEMKLFFCFPHNTNSRGGGGELEHKKRWGCSSRILKLTPKENQSGRGSRIF